jgi:hypothetical protein
MLGQAQLFLIFLLVKTPETIPLILWTPHQNYVKSLTPKAHFVVTFKLRLIRKKYRKINTVLINVKIYLKNIGFLFLTLIPCILEYVESNQQNSILLYFSFYDGFYMFRQNNAILREQLCSFLSHFNVNMIGDKS